LAEEKKNKCRFKGHESFILRDGWLNKGLRAVSADKAAFQEYYGADTLGVGPNMAKSIRYWLNTAGLVKQCKGGVTLTGTGEMILKYDPYIEDDFTLWIIHVNIVQNMSEATSWNLFFNRFDMDEFTKEQMSSAVISLAGQVTDRVAEKSVISDCDTILQMYVKHKTEDYDPEEKKISPFYELGLIRNQNGRYAKVQPDLNRLDPMAVWYVLGGYKDIDSIGIDQLVDGYDLPGKIMNLKRSAIIGYIGHLADQGLLSLNQTAGLDMVYLNKRPDREEIIKEYYCSRP
jgi:hypothetical protein